MEVFFHKWFAKKYGKVNRILQKQIDMKIFLFLQNLFARELNNHALRGKYAGYRSINVTGYYRALYRVMDRNSVKFFDIDTHENLYG